MLNQFRLSFDTKLRFVKYTFLVYPWFIAKISTCRFFPFIPRIFLSSQREKMQKKIVSRHFLSVQHIDLFSLSLRGVTLCIFFMIWFRIKSVIHISEPIITCICVLVWEWLTIISGNFSLFLWMTLHTKCSLTTLQVMGRLIENMSI